MTKVVVTCPDHGDFLISPAKHLSGAGCKKCSKHISSGETKLSDFISYWFDVKTSDRTTMNGKEIDILIPELNLGIEYNGVYWHSEQAHKNPKHHKIQKTKLCADAGIRLIHIEEYENTTVVKKTLAHILGIDEERYYARCCEVSISDCRSAEVIDFLNNNHLQGPAMSGEAYCLRINEVIVSVMVLGNVTSERGHSGKERVELKRFSSVGRVVGGASKLLKAFCRNTPECETIISYSDNRWFTGDMYNKLGFSLVSEIGPDYKYVKGKSILPKHKFKRSELKRRSDIEFKEEESEIQNAHRNGWYRFWDCGKKKWELNL